MNGGLLFKFHCELDGTYCVTSMMIWLFSGFTFPC